MTITDILRDLQDPNTSPGRLSAILMFLSADYSRKSEEFSKVVIMRAKAWKELRAKHGSDKQAEMEWNATPEGIAETMLRLEMKSSERMQSAIKAMLRTKEHEARNQY